MLDLNPIWFYWDGPINDDRLKILKDSVYSTRIFNPNNKITIITNTLTQSQFDDKFNIIVKEWDNSFFEGIPMSIEKIEKYKKAHPRDFSDLFRLILLYQFGGSYVDTDDVCIAPIKSPKNTICRSYDPHTSFYNKIEPDECVPGFTREIRGYDEIPMFPRNDCWQNFEPKSSFIWDMLNNEKFQNANDIVSICGDFSWQSITNETCLKFIHKIGTDWNFGLTLLYLYEDFVAYCSHWDRCIDGGEMCDIWKSLPNMDDYEWGKYKCSYEIGEQFYSKIIETYPFISHMWLHIKNDKKEWIEEIDWNSEYSVSTWIYNIVKKKIYG